MDISTKKTKAVVKAKGSKEQVRWKLSINNKNTEYVVKLIYLGIEIVSNRDHTKEIRAQANTASSVSGSLEDVIRRSYFRRNQ